VLTHISARYSHDTRELEAEARQVFAPVRAARDGTEGAVPLRDAVGEGPRGGPASPPHMVGLAGRK
jgi:hypothetical protein